MSEAVRSQVYKNLNLKQTDELIKIWKTNDRTEWSDAAFEVIEELLRDRLGQVPPQNGPVLVRQKDSEEVDEKLEEWESKLLDEENQPELYDTLEVLELRDKLNNVAKAAVIIYIFTGSFNFPIIRMLVLQFSVSAQDFWQAAPDLLILTLDLFIRIAIIYFPLKALTHILRILMEMEFNSRKAT